MRATPRTPWFYRLLLRLFPARFRQDFGDEMSRLYVEQRAAAGSSTLTRARIDAGAALDLTSQAVAERWRGDAPPPRSPRKGSHPMERLIADTRYSLRALLRSPGFTVASVLTLALGLGANVAMFTAINSALLQPLPYPEPDRLVRVWPQTNFNEAFVAHIRDSAPAIESLSGTSGWLFTLTGGGDPQQISGLMVTWDFFDILGVQPALGRGFTVDDSVPGQADVVILSHGMWVNVFGSDPDIIGKRLELASGDYQTRRVIGVMGEDFRPLQPWYRLWSPLDIDPATTYLEDRSWYVNSLVGRLADGATAEQATAQVRAIAAALHDEWPERWEEHHAERATVDLLQDNQVEDIEGTLLLLFGAVAAVLLIACANVANLLLARGTARARDLAVRSALGASRRRLAAQLLTESMLLGIAGGALGIAIAWSGLRLIAASVPSEYYQVAEATIDPMVFAFAFGVSIVAVLVFGLVPALRASGEGSSSVAATSRGAGSRSGNRLTSGLVAAEVALSVVLVIGSGLMLRSLWNLYDHDLGFNTGGALTFRISIPEGRFEPEALRPHYQQIWESIAAVPGVERVGGIHLLPLTGSNWSFPYEAEDHPLAEGAPRPDANFRIVTPNYFETIGIPLLSGRAFTNSDTGGGEAVGMINRRMAEELWPGEDAVGKSLTVFGDPFRIVGVVENIQQHGVRREVQAEMYRPFDQWPTGGMFAVVRTSGDPVSLAPAVQRAVWDVDDRAPLASVRPMAEVFGSSVSGDRFVSYLVAGFGALALLLGTVGVYGVTAYTMSRRLGEFGVRMALGADRPRILIEAVAQGIAPALLGVVIGVAGAVWATRLLEELLFQVAPLDLITFVAVPATLVVVAAMACALPAWRASRLDPVVVLRHE